MLKLPLPINKLSHNIIIGIADLIANGSVAHLKINKRCGGFITDLVGIAVARFEARAHARLQYSFSAVGHQSSLPGHYVDKLILL